MSMRSQRGQSATEFLVVFPAVVFLVFGVIQMALLYQGRATLNYATMLAARAGALHNGNMGEMRNALARGLAPMFAHKATTTGYAEALAKATVETAALSNMTKIEILNPTKEALDDFGRPRLDGQPGTELPNDTLNYRTTTPGSKSKLSVQDANLLHVRVTYCYRLIVPIIDRMLHSAVNGGAVEATGMSNPFGIGNPPFLAPCTNPLMDGPRIQIRSEAIVRMQTPFYKANVGSAAVPGTPPKPPKPGTPTDPVEPEVPADPEVPPADPSDPTVPNPPGGGVC
ncbi:MAG TPA: TadE/TadG family type IV pilus assembly protein [Telluria sp.]|nr:TadE/TadG family type IV pilus assembly protein [Telluria sp.]